MYVRVMVFSVVLTFVESTNHMNICDKFHNNDIVRGPIYENYGISVYVYYTQCYTLHSNILLIYEVKITYRGAFSCF